MEQKLFSIIIPTKNRFKYLKETVLVLLRIEFDDFEIVIHDNSDNNEQIKDFFNQLDNEKIKYYHTDKEIGVVENSDLAVSKSTGKYICMIGDDDVVSNNIIEVIKWMENNSIDSCFGRNVRFFWQDVIFNKHHFFPLTIWGTQGTRKLNAYKELLKSVNKGALSLEKMPRVYHGIVTKEKLNEVFKLTGSYFPGASPDMANSVALSVVVEKHYETIVPFIISGHSYKSAGGMGTRGKHKAKLENVAWLPKDTIKKWDERIPKVWTAQTIYAVSMLEALKRIKKEKVLKKFNFQYHYATFVNYNRNLSDELVVESIKVHKLKFTIYNFNILIKRSVNYFKNFCETRFSLTRNLIYKDVTSLNQAFDIVNKIK